MGSRRSTAWILIGNPENRRVSLFQEALAERGLAPARVVSWLELAERGPAAFGERELELEEAIVRIDSAGESFEVERALLRLGHPAAVEAGYSTIEPKAIDALKYDRGAIVCPRQQHEGFLRVLRTSIAPVLAPRPGWRVLSPLDEIEVLFDKRRTSRRYHALGIPVPSFFDEIGTVEALDQEMDRRGVGSVFVKLACSSSASCLAIYARDRGSGRARVTTTIEQARTGWYNSLRLRRVERRESVLEILGWLIKNGSQIEAAVPKAELEGANFDCRVVVIGGAPEFVVVRQNQHPITNLHLGGWRGSVEALAREAGEELAKGLESCRRAAETHRCFTVGVDLMFERGFAGHRILESNAFGDLLPGLVKDGSSVYGRQIRLLTDPA